MYIWGFRARQHLKLLAPVMNDWWWWWPNDIRGPWGLKFPDIYLTGEKKPYPGNLSQPGIEPRPTACQACVLPPVPQRWTNNDRWTVWRYKKEGWEEGRVEKAEFAVKHLPLGRTLWLIDWLIDWYATRLHVCVVWKCLDSTGEWGTIQQLSISIYFYDVIKENPPFSGYIYHKHNTDYK